MTTKKSKTNPHPYTPVRGKGMFLEKEDKIFQACKDFRQFIKERTGEHCTDYILQRRWRTIVEAFIQQQLKGDQGHFLKVLQWYVENIEGDYIPECLTLPRFCTKFRSIEKARSRQMQQTGSDSEAPTVTTIVHKPTIIKGTKCATEDTW